MAILSGRKPKATAALENAAPSWVVAWLLTGEPPPPGDPGSAEFEKVRRRMGAGERDTWRQHERDVLAVWTRDNPGTRPPGWWRWMAPEPRKVKPGRGFHAQADQRRPNDRGLPILWSTTGGLIYSGRVEVESEPAYLKRLSLLLPDEARRLRAGAYKPVTMDIGTVKT